MAKVSRHPAARAIKVNMDELIDWAKLSRKAALELLEDLKKIVAKTTIETHHEVVQGEPVYRGALRNATQFKAPIVKGQGPIKSISGIIFIVGNPAIYGNVQDLGRRPGMPTPKPPAGVLRRWIEFQVAHGKWTLDPRRNRDKALSQATFLLARKIRENPAKGLKFFEEPEIRAQFLLDLRVNEAATKAEHKMTS